MVFQYNIRTGEVFGIEELTNNSITISKCDKKDFKYIVIAPRFSNKMVLFGELNKFVTVSETRFLDFEETGEGVFVTLTGVPSEKVIVTVYNGQSAVAVNCVIGDTGLAKLTIAQSVPTCV